MSRVLTFLLVMTELPPADEAWPERKSREPKDKMLSPVVGCATGTPPETMLEACQAWLKTVVLLGKVIVANNVMTSLLKSPARLETGKLSGVCFMVGDLSEIGVVKTFIDPLPVEA